MAGMTGIVILAPLAVLAVLWMLRSQWQLSRHGAADLGSVSHSWLAEQRLGRKDDMR
jgi:hypothetical protein